MNLKHQKRKYRLHSETISFEKRKFSDPKYDIANRVKQQEGIRGQLILFQSLLETPVTILNNAANRINASVAVKRIRNVPNGVEWELSISNEVLATGIYPFESAARKGLSELAIEDLKKSCFSIVRKIHPRDSPMVQLSSSSSGNHSKQPLPKSPDPLTPGTPQSPPVGGIGAQMLMRMGWSGGGLGANEQGATNLIQPFIQIQRQGFGTKNMAQEVTKILQEYLSSGNINAVSFSPEFSKKERTVIHQIAQRLNLKSKSYGSGEDRLLVIQSKVKPWDIVYSLLDSGNENDQLKLIMPTSFI